MLVLSNSAKRIALEHAGNAKMFRDHGQAMRARFVEVSRDAAV